MPTEERKKQNKKKTTVLEFLLTLYSIQSHVFYRNQANVRHNASSSELKVLPRILQQQEASVQ